MKSEENNCWKNPTFPVSPPSRVIGKTVTVVGKEAGYLRPGQTPQSKIPSRARIPTFSLSASPLEQLEYFQCLPCNALAARGSLLYSIFRVAVPRCSVLGRARLHRLAEKLLFGRPWEGHEQKPLRVPEGPCCKYGSDTGHAFTFAERVPGGNAQSLTGGLRRSYGIAK